jgi:type IV pilus assembly protein PilA
MIRVSRGSKGFTLIELLIVVAIIGILAAIAIPAYSGYTKKSKVTGIVNSMGAIKNALTAYYTEQGAGPGTDLTLAQISSVLGVTPSTQYASNYTYTVANTRITATANAATLSLGAGQDIYLTAQDTAFQTWQWGGTCDQTYQPKNN